jgi:plastocyanin
MKQVRLGAMFQRPLAALLAILLAACTNPPATSSSRVPPASERTPTSTQVSGRAPSGALVTLEPAGGAPQPEGNAVLDQFSKAFVPETLFVRVGQPVIFKNSEDQLHNVTVVRSRTGAAVFNISQNQGDVYTHTFDAAGEYDVTCDVHPGMRGVIVATTTPYAVYADPRGGFSFPNIPPGQYTLRVSAGGRTAERTVDVKGATMDLGDVRPGGGD